MFSLATQITTGLLFLTLTSSVVSLEAPECSYYLTQSKLEGAMRGIYAGKDFSLEEHVEDGPLVTVISNHVR